MKEGEREVQERLQAHVMDEKETEQLKKDREPACESSAVSKQYKDHTIEAFCEAGETEDELSCEQKMKEMQNARHDLQQRASEETRSYIQEHITEEEEEEEEEEEDP